MTSKPPPAALATKPAVAEPSPQLIWMEKSPAPANGLASSMWATIALSL
ncbi:MAG: hypothetical protein ACR2NR_00285 [Solirubrobacteraceae bacterium]